MGFRVQSLGLRVWGLGFGVWDLGFVIWGSGSGVGGLGFRLLGLDFEETSPSFPPDISRVSPLPTLNFLRILRRRAFAKFYQRVGEGVSWYQTVSE